MIQSNKLTELITIEQLTVSGNSYGEQVQTWSTIYKGYFSLLNDSANTKFDDGSNYVNSISFYGRFIPNLQKKGVRIIYNDLEYQIDEITNVQRNRAIIIRCINAK